jgi:hypothetical protein
MAFSRQGHRLRVKKKDEPGAATLDDTGGEPRDFFWPNSALSP